METLLGTIIALLAAGVIVSSPGGDIKYQNGTTLNGYDVSNLSYEDAKDILCEEYARTHEIFTITDRNGNHYEINLGGHLSVHIKGDSSVLPKENKPLFGQAKVHEVTFMVSPDKEVSAIIKNTLISSGNFNLPPADAYVSEADGIPAIIPETPGTTLKNMDDVVGAIISAIYMGETSFEIADGYYQEAAIKETDPGLAAELAKQQRLHSMDVSFTSGGQTFQLSKELYDEWFINGSADMDAVYRWADDVIASLNLVDVSFTVHDKEVSAALPASLIIDRDAFALAAVSDVQHNLASSRVIATKVSGGMLQLPFLCLDQDLKQLCYHNADGTEVILGDADVTELAVNGCYVANEPGGLVASVSGNKISITGSDGKWASVGLDNEDVASILSDIKAIVIL